MLCDTHSVNEKQFWQMIKSKRTIRSGSHFILNGRVLSSDIDILDMWDSHFENLGKPSTEPHYDEDFKEYIDGKVKHIILQKYLNFSSCIEDIFRFEKVKKVCLNLPCNKAGGIDNTAYEHLKFGGKQLWQVLSDLFVSMYSTHNVPSSLKIQLLLPIFKGKKLKTSNKDNYRDITLFSVLCKVFELLLLNHLESIAQEQNYFSDLQFGFSNGVGCIEASYVISESVNQAVEQGDNVFACFLDVRKAFDTVWHNGLLFKLYEELSIDSGLWLTIQ